MINKDTKMIHGGHLSALSRGYDRIGCIPSIHETAFFNISSAVREQSREIGSIADPLIDDES